MYLVTRLKKYVHTNEGKVYLNTNGLCGVMLVYEDEKEAIEAAKGCNPPAQVLEMSEK